MHELLNRNGDRDRWWKHLAPLSALCCLTVVACADSYPPQDLVLPGLPPYELSHLESGPQVTRDQLVTHGERSGPLGFGLIPSIALHSDGTLAVADSHRCSVILIARPGTRFLGRLGGCGSGPGEFQQIRSIAYLSDLLLIYDRRAAAISALSPDGTEAWRQAVNLPPGPGIVDMYPINDSILLVSLERVPEPERLLEPVEPVGLLNLRSGEVVEWLIRDVARSSTLSPQRVRRKSACAAFDNGSGGTVWVANDWLFEGVAFRYPEGTVLHRFLNVPGRSEQKRAIRASFPSQLSGTACGADRAVFKFTWSTTESMSGSESSFEVWSHSGARLSRFRAGPELPAAHGRLAAVRGDTVFLITGVLGYPVVAELVLSNLR